MSGVFFTEEFSADCDVCDGTGSQWVSEDTLGPCSACSERAWNVEMDRQYDAWRERDL